MQASPLIFATSDDTKVRDAQATKHKLLGAALASFSTKGYDASTTRGIEAAAGVKRGLISYHYGSKQALWKASAEHIMAVSERELSEAMKSLAQVDKASRLRFFVRAYVAFCARHPELNRLMIQEGMECEWRLQWLTPA